MCPIPPLLSADSSDEVVVMFLDSRNVDDPMPSNVMADVDPFAIDPQLSSDNHWYMYKSVVSDITDKESVIKGQNGYWEFMNDINIPISTAVGMKITRKFYLGNETSGDKTAFKMHEYHIELEKNKFKENSLSRIFSEIDDMKNEEKSNINGENTDSKLPCLANKEEKNSSLKHCENELQVNKENEGQSKLPNDLTNEEAGYEDFIEFKDFGLEDGNSLFSDNTSSSVKSMTSDENFESEIMGFDPEAMISDIANSVNASVSSDPVAIQSPLSPDAPLPRVMGKSKSEVSTSSSSESGGDSTSAKHSENGSSYKRVKSRSSRRMVKLGKRQNFNYTRHVLQSKDILTYCHSLNQSSTAAGDCFPHRLPFVVTFDHHKWETTTIVFYTTTSLFSLLGKRSSNKHF